jgi:hypothetical protein
MAKATAPKKVAPKKPPKASAPPVKQENKKVNTPAQAAGNNGLPAEVVPYDGE